MGCIILVADLATGSFLKDWAIVYLLGGGVVVVVGLVFGCLIWQKNRTAAEKIEGGNREAMAQFEKASDRALRLKSELSNATGD